MAMAGHSAVASPLISPGASSDAVRAARSLAPQESLIFDYRTEAHTAAKPDTIDAGNVMLGDDFVAVNGQRSASLDDYSLCRNFYWFRAQPMENQSCYAGPAFRQRELVNRRGLRAALQAASEKSPAAQIPLAVRDLYWAEQELAAQEVVSDPLVASRSTDTLDWRLGNNVVVHTSLTGSTFAKSERSRLARYLARHVDLHPQVRAAILDSGLFPNRIEIVRQSGGGESRETLTFSNFRHARIAYPLPIGLQSSVQMQAELSTMEGAGLKRTLHVISNKSVDVPPNLDKLVKEMAAAAAAKQSLNAMFLFLNITQQYGFELLNDPTSRAKFDTIKPLFQGIISDKIAVELMRANELSGNANPTPERVVAARYWASGQIFDKLPFGTFRYVAYANLVRQSGDTSKWDPTIARSMPAITDCYWKHIAAYPWAGNAFKDLGDSYLQNFDMQNAWLAWDLGRLVDGKASSALLGQIDEYEQNLRRGMPDNF